MHGGGPGACISKLPSAGVGAFGRERCTQTCATVSHSRYFADQHEDDHRRRPAAEQCVCGPEPSRRAARITAASPERRSRGACSASVTARAARRQRVAVGVGEAAGRRRRCVRRRRQNQMLRAELRDVESCVRCFAAPLAAATSELYLQGSVGRGGNGETPGDHTPKRWSSPDMRRPRRRAAVRHAAVRHAAGGGAGMQANF